MKLQFVRFLVSIVLMMTILWACNPFRPQIRKSPQGPMPKTFSLYSHNAKGPQKWWEMFKDPELNALVDEALSENFTIRQAWARLKQVNAAVVQAGAGLYPDLKVTAGSTYEWRKTWTEEQSAAATGELGCMQIGLFKVGVRWWRKSKIKKYMFQWRMAMAAVHNIRP